MNILITGSNGFIARNLIAELGNRGYKNIFQYDRNCSIEDLNYFCSECNFVYHLAAVNRPERIEEFIEGNCEFTSLLLKTLKKYNNTSPIVVTSSIQADLQNPYGLSKKATEQLIWEHSEINKSLVKIYRLPNVFGKWCKPNYNSVIATFCNNIANDLPIKVNESETTLNLVYIDDVIDSLINDLETPIPSNEKHYSIATSYHIKLGEIVELLNEFKQYRTNNILPNTNDEFQKKLYSTFLSYLPKSKFKYSLVMNKDERGSFTEIFKSEEKGQFSVNITKPGITKGNHWHNLKIEKFVVVSGSALISLRKVNEKEIIEIRAEGENIEVVEIPPGYTHNIKNIGEKDLVTFMWCNECFNKEKPDTFHEEVMPNEKV